MISDRTGLASGGFVSVRTRNFAPPLNLNGYSGFKLRSEACLGTSSPSWSFSPDMIHVDHRHRHDVFPPLPFVSMFFSTIIWTASFTKVTNVVCEKSQGEGRRESVQVHCA
jgi:hypothetical protein